MAVDFRVSPGLDVNPCRITLLDSHPTADLRSRAGLRSLRADSNQHRPSCGLQVPAFGVPPDRIKPLSCNAGHDFAFLYFDNKGVQPSISRFSEPMLFRALQPTDTGVSRDFIAF